MSDLHGPGTRTTLIDMNIIVVNIKIRVIVAIKTRHIAATADADKVVGHETSLARRAVIIGHVNRGASARLDIIATQNKTIVAIRKIDPIIAAISRDAFYNIILHNRRCLIRQAESGIIIVQNTIPPNNRTDHPRRLRGRSAVKHHSITTSFYMITYKVIVVVDTVGNENKRAVGRSSRGRPARKMTALKHVAVRSATKIDSYTVSPVRGTER